MAIPLIAAGVAARAIVSKLATRAVGGITGAGAKTVAPVYRNMETGSVKVVNPQSTNPAVNQQIVKNTNAGRTFIAKQRKLGEEAKFQSYAVEPNSARGAISTAKKIKINSGNTRAK